MMSGFDMVILCFSFITTLGSSCFAMCEATYPSILAFSFLNEIMREFLTKYELTKVNVVRRPYSFIEFGKTCNSLPVELLFKYINEDIHLLCTLTRNAL